MLVDDIGDVTITNDGATILKLLEVEQPAAKVHLQHQDVSCNPVCRSCISVPHAHAWQQLAWLHLCRVALSYRCAADPGGAGGFAGSGGGRWHHLGGHLRRRVAETRQ